MNESFRVVAIISAFNEEDIVSKVIEHLINDDIDVYLIDNRSTDETVNEARRWVGRGLIAIEEFPGELNDDPESHDYYDWTGILFRKEELSKEIRADWFIHHDADEIRRSPWPGISLKKGIKLVNDLGYNCIDFHVVNFPPVDEGFKKGHDPLSYFKYYDECSEFDRIQIKCWKSGISGVSLVSSGGHRVQFEGMNVFPIKFLLLHYPIRGQEHGKRKVFSERKNRFLESEKTKGWHIQYEDFKDDSLCFLRNPESLSPFNLEKARLELMMTDNIVKHLEFRERKANEELISIQSHAKGLEQYSNALKQHTEDLERQIGGLDNHITELNNHIAELNNHIAELDNHTIELEKSKKMLSDNIQELGQSLTNLRNSLSWRITAPLRILYDLILRVKRRSLNSIHKLARSTLKGQK